MNKNMGRKLSLMLLIAFVLGLGSAFAARPRDLSVDNQIFAYAGRPEGVYTFAAEEGTISFVWLEGGVFRLVVNGIVFLGHRKDSHLVQEPGSIAPWELSVASQVRDYLVQLPTPAARAWGAILGGLMMAMGIPGVLFPLWSASRLFRSSPSLALHILFTGGSHALVIAGLALFLARTF